MSLQHQTFLAIPEETARVARAAFPKGNLLIRMRDELGVSSLMKILHPSIPVAVMRLKRLGTWQ